MARALRLHLIPQILAVCGEFGILDTILTAGGPDLATRAHATPISLPRGRSLAITPDQVQESYGYLGDAERARRGRDGRAQLDLATNDAHIEAARVQGVASPFHLWIYSLTSGHTEPMRERLVDLAARLPNEVRLGYSVLPHEQYLRDAIRTNPGFPVQLPSKACSRLRARRQSLSHRAARRALLPGSAPG